MDERQLNDALFAQMFAEQQDYRAWLMTLPPDEILDHAAEFVVREDILVELEAFDLPADQAAALLAQAGLFDEICLVQMQGERALPLTELTDSFRQYTGFDRKAYERLDTALSELIAHKKDGDEVYIVGSLYLAGEVKALLRRFDDD